MKSEEIRNLSETEIEQKVRAMRKDLFDLTYDSQAGRVEKPHRIAHIRRDIARCLTVLRQKTGKPCHHV